MVSASELFQKVVRPSRFCHSAIPVLLSIFCIPKAQADLTVASAISMGDAMEEISKSYSAETGKKIRHTFAGTNVLARQIEAGAPIDVFVSADTATMDGLVVKGLIGKGSVRVIAGNELVVIVPAGSKRSLDSPADLLSVDRIAMADPNSVPAGIYAKKWLSAEHLWTRLQPNAIPLQNVRAALVATETGNAPAAIVYRSDAASSRKVKIAYTADPGKTGTIEYPAAVIGASAKKAEALAFLKFLATEESRKTLVRHGFTAPADK